MINLFFPLAMWMSTQPWSYVMLKRAPDLQLCSIGKLWNGPDAVLAFGKRLVCVFPETASESVCIPSRKIRFSPRRATVWLSEKENSKLRGDKRLRVPVDLDAVPGRFWRRRVRRQTFNRQDWVTSVRTECSLTEDTEGSAKEKTWFRLLWRKGKGLGN